ncbi:MAG: histidine phosphatase family protein [Chlamydiales bacterium]
MSISPLDITRIYIVRHGQTDSNKDDNIQGQSDSSPYYNLNEKGVEEAHTVAKKLQHVFFDQFFSSDLKRAIRTCEIITGGKQPVTHKSIRERDFKHWEGRPMTEFYIDADENWKQVESDESVRDRALKRLKKIGELYKGKTVLVVTHGGLMRNVLIRILGLTCEVGDIIASNASYYTLEYSSNGSWTLGSERSGIYLPGELAESS